MKQKCPVCRGRGRVAIPCPICKGIGEIEGKKDKNPRVDGVSVSEKVEIKMELAKPDKNILKKGDDK